MDFKECPRCHSKIFIYMKECPFCGYREGDNDNVSVDIDEVKSIVKIKENNSPKGLKECPKCHSKIFQDMEECPFCGFKEGDNLEEINKVESIVDVKEEIISNNNENNLSGKIKECPKCHSKIFQDMKECLFCGYREDVINEEENVESIVKVKNNDKFDVEIDECFEKKSKIDDTIIVNQQNQIDEKLQIDNNIDKNQIKIANVNKKRSQSQDSKVVIKESIKEEQNIKSSDEKIICPSCGEWMPRNAKVCPWCGATLD